MVDPLFVLLIVIVVVALVFDFINGFHDAANSIATVVSTRVLSPGLAVIWAAFFNFVAAFVFPHKVATTIGKGLITPTAVTEYVILAGLVGAIVWNLLHLVARAAHQLLARADRRLRRGGRGQGRLRRHHVRGWTKTLVSMFVSPVVGLVLGLLHDDPALLWLLRRSMPTRVDKWFRKLQLVSAGLYSLGHGGNDAQKTMGIIAILHLHVPANTGHATQDDIHVTLWMVFACYAAIALGTLFGGWRIVKTMGTKITKLRPVGGFCAETAAAMTLFANSYLGIPVSTTHTITGAIMGVGATHRLSAVRWGVATQIVWAWVLTIPASSLIAAAFYWGLKPFIGG